MRQLPFNLRSLLIACVALCVSSCQPFFAPTGTIDSFADYAFLGLCKTDDSTTCGLLDLSEGELEERLSKKLAPANLEAGYSYVFVPLASRPADKEQTTIERNLRTNGVIVRESFCCSYPFQGPSIFQIRIREKGCWGEISNSRNSISPESLLAQKYQVNAILLTVYRRLL